MNNTMHCITALSSIDSYKLGHADQYPPGTEYVYSNFTPRSMKHLNVPEQWKDNKVVWLGNAYFVKWLNDLWNDTFFSRDIDEVVSEFKKLVAPFCPQDPEGMNRLESRIRELHEYGVLPVIIKALPEGSIVPIGVPVMTIQNTDPRFYWIVSYIENQISAELWKPSTVATIFRVYRNIMNRWSELTGSDKSFVNFQIHDFSVRGMSGIDDATKCGLGHLAFFTGSDNIPAVNMVNSIYYGRDTFVAASVPASEHSTTTANIIMNASKMGEVDEQTLAAAELEYLKRYITEIYPSGVCSYVSDSFDFWTVVTKFIPALKDEILNRKPDSNGLAKAVVRADSGNPMRIICGYDYVTVEDIDSESGIVDAVYHCNFDDVILDEKTGKFYHYDMSTGCIEQIEEHIVKGAIQVLAETFGTTTNEGGFKSLNQRIGLIYGEGISPSVCEDILRRLAAKGYAADCVVFGVGSFPLQYTTRDTLGYAMKATNITVDGVEIALFKDPKTDDGTKKSAKGFLQVIRVDGEYVLKQDVSELEETRGELLTVYLEGEVPKTQSIADIRKRLGTVV